MRYELTDQEWTPIKGMLPNTPRGRAHLLFAIRYSLFAIRHSLL
jgi:transposase